MTIEQTLSIIKPDGVRKKIINEIQKRFVDAGLTIINAKMLQLSMDDAKTFYGIHKDKPFFNDLLTYITSGPVMVQVLEGENAIELNRKLMGATNPQDAEEGTIRRDFASSIEENVVHGSDGPDTARTEIEFFFG
jgi:nucleoside-diphosphate kinase